MKRKKPHPLCRPQRTSSGTVPLRLRADGRWVRDNGDPSLAFVGLATDAVDDTSATVWIANCACKNFIDCPLSRALAYAGQRYGSATVIRRRASPKRRIPRRSKAKK